MKKGCPLVPEGFSTEGNKIIKQIQELCAGDMGIIIGAQSWQSFLGGKTEEGKRGIISKSPCRLKSFE